MSVHSGETTKDGKKWYFTCYYKDYKGITKQYKSKKYLTRKEAEKNELLFKTKNENPSYIKFEVIILDYIDYLYKTKKESTAFDYSNVIKKHIIAVCRLRSGRGPRPHSSPCEPQCRSLGSCTVGSH